MSFRLFCLTAFASLLATTQAELLINSPAPNSLVEHEGTIQVVVPVHAHSFSFGIHDSDSLIAVRLDSSYETKSRNITRCWSRPLLSRSLFQFGRDNIHGDLHAPGLYRRQPVDDVPEFHADCASQPWWWCGHSGYARGTGRFTCKLL